jgi:hypothetical protein
VSSERHGKMSSTSLFRARPTGTRARLLTIERLIIIFLSGLVAYLRLKDSATEKPSLQVHVIPEPIVQAKDLTPLPEASASQGIPIHADNNGFKICNTAVTRTMSANVVEGAIAKRSTFYEQALPELKTMLNKEAKRDGQLDPCGHVDCTYTKLKGWSGLRHDHARWSMMGSPVLKCPYVRSFGTGDEEKRFCWSHELEQDENCIVFSIGSNNLWGFEASFAKTTSCKIHTFDCTVKAIVPAKLRDRVTFHHACLGSESHGERYHTLTGLMKLAGVSSITFLKMDIEASLFFFKSSVCRLGTNRYSHRGLNGTCL